MRQRVASLSTMLFSWNTFLLLLSASRKRKQNNSSEVNLSESDSRWDGIGLWVEIHCILHSTDSLTITSNLELLKLTRDHFPINSQWEKLRGCCSLLLWQSPERSNLIPTNLDDSHYLFQSIMMKKNSHDGRNIFSDSVEIESTVDVSSYLQPGGPPLLKLTEESNGSDNL